MLFCFLCFLILISFVIFRYKRRHMYKLASAISGPNSELPVIGSTHSLAGSNEDILKNMQIFSYESMKKNRILRIWLGPLLYFLIQDPADLETILKTCLEKDELHRFVRCIFGNGGIFAPVAIWRRRRKILVPAFSPKIVENFMEIFSEQSIKLVSRLSDCAESSKVKMWPYISAYSFDAVCETVMGTKINAQDNLQTPLLKAMNILLDIAAKRIFHLWLQPEWLFKFFPMYKKHLKYLKIMNEFTNKIIAKKREEMKKTKSGQAETGEFDFGNYKRQSFLDHLIKLSGGENGYNEEELREEVLTLTIAGTDTTAIAICYTLKLLAMYPNVQENVHRELQEVLGASDRALVIEDLLKLKYLERVVKESLRLYPPGPFVVRKILQDIVLPSGNILPAGSGAVGCIWGLHRDPKYWGPDAECFDPDRFLPERYKPQHSCIFIPFSTGLRNCPGNKYAMMSIKTALSAIVRKYKIYSTMTNLGPDPQIKSKFEIMMKATDDFEVILEKRASDYRAK